MYLCTLKRMLIHLGLEKVMNLDTLTAISPIDGRYRNKTELLAGYFSEYALIRYRVRVEIEYFIALCELPLPQLEDFDHQLFEPLRDIYRHFTRVSPIMM
jgi:adenylosuccinate lyase